MLHACAPSPASSPPGLSTGGTLPANFQPVVASLCCHCRWLHGNNLSGMLPDAWAAPTSFTVLKEVTLGDNPGLTGTLPAAWGARPDALPLLERINASRTGLSGPLPPEWGPYPSQLTEL